MSSSPDMNTAASPGADSNTRSMQRSLSAVSMKTWMHNKERKTYLGSRTGPEWRKLLLFYFTYHSVLTVGLFAICYSVMVSTLPEVADGPKLQNLIQPALVSYPNKVTYTIGDTTTQDEMIAEIDDLLARNRSMPLDPLAYPNCHASPYGYDDSKNPCVFLRLNRVFGFVPPADAVVNCSIQFDSQITPAAPLGTEATVTFESGDEFIPTNFPYNEDGFKGDQLLVFQVDLSNSPTFPVRINIDCQAALGQEELEDPFFGYKRVELRIDQKPVE